MLLQSNTKATDFQQICTYFIQEDYAKEKETEKEREREEEKKNIYNDLKDLGK